MDLELITEELSMIEYNHADLTYDETPDEEQLLEDFEQEWLSEDEGHWEVNCRVTGVEWEFVRDTKALTLF